jgi:hypothetical protein
MSLSQPSRVIVVEPVQAEEAAPAPVQPPPRGAPEPAPPAQAPAKP